ncbi:MAG: hypothetical protein A3I12_05830 [Gammaproteobacteria bacterium RIFCSPLOWO2_02_FULL_38_11]|nr:MAG: hypothetical protein A3B69_02305 [Gammaproteobacteria bacterium RIFCSPHIGHO2_02_FULL_38_33]OGT24470.1 MAG: hypothetical protein A2W47_03455 [Gammaproteobacteria bacterium RIFCSPHIGHO2_12_38_15]OGT69069.1 MAG: hypothetical protein A3I12_05830 [Gammaproteobacteria bacterium RIFCSPLOWO2_02_FULL_38_11]OGT77643.1 MAG: hypothetical protein A3G71_01990 [Gammaproteobacteria bacterium RIFCSPLOWO2_12_FULL_38_14]
MDKQSSFYIKKLTLLGAISNIILAIIKIVGGFMGHSHALISDGIHSFADLITDGAILFAARMSTRKANTKYPYGYARIETLTTGIVALLLLLTGLGIIYDASESLFIPKEAQSPSYFVIYIASIALLIKEFLFRLTNRFAQKAQSPLLKATAWHHRSDAATSLVVLIGILGATLGYLHSDAFAAIVVAVIIIKMGWELISSSFKELLDVGLSPAALSEIRAVTLNESGVRAIHQLRTRFMAGRVFLDMHLLVSPYLSVSEGHYIAAKVHRELMKNISNLADVTIHVDPEEDDDEEETTTHTLNLPSREKLIPLLKERWGNLLSNNAYQKLILTYLSGKISIHIGIPSEKLNDLVCAENLLRELKTRLNDLDFIQKITLSVDLHE